MRPTWYRSPARIEWSPDGAWLLARLPDDRLRLYAADTREVRGMGKSIDARFLPDGRIVSYCSAGTLRWHDPLRGVLDQRSLGAYSVESAWIAPDGQRLAIVAARASVTVRSFGTDGPSFNWALDLAYFKIAAEFERLSVALSRDGERLAFGYESRFHDAARPAGRGFLVVELATNKAIARAFTPVVRVDGPTRFAFDRSGHRLAQIHPEPDASIGVVRLARLAGDDTSARTLPGGARAVALDDRGIIAVFAYPAALPGAAGRLRVVPDTVGARRLGHRRREHAVARSGAGRHRRGRGRSDEPMDRVPRVGWGDRDRPGPLIIERC